MIAEYHGRIYPLELLRAWTFQKLEGANMLGISEAAEHIGMHTVGAKISFNRLIDDIPLPGIAHWKEQHFVVVVEANHENVTIADPDAPGVKDVSPQEFLKGWVGDANGFEKEGVILLLEPTTEFYNKGGKETAKGSWSYIRQNFFLYKKLLRYYGAAAVIGVLLMVTFPFILQTLVDEGIEKQDISLLNLILLAWLVLFVCQVGLDFLRHFLLFHLGTKVNIRLLTDFMIKVMQLPARFFQTKLPDDILQTFFDNAKVHRFLTNEGLSLVYAGLLTLLFSVVLVVFKPAVFLVFVLFALLQGLAVMYLFRNRQALSHDRHNLSAEHYSQMQDLFRGIKDIKLGSAERTQRWAWERSEAKLYRVGKSQLLSNELLQKVPFYLSEMRNIIILYIAANAVVDGSMTLGVLVAILFILLQLNHPLKELVEFFLGRQAVAFNLARMNEIHQIESEEGAAKIDDLPRQAVISGENVSFRYEGSHSEWIIRHLDFKIEPGKTTVIIGPSGSGKTTLLNLILKFFEPNEGILKLGDVPLNNVSPRAWRKMCGVVPQDGHIFYDTIARNIALGDEVIDSKRLLDAARIANMLPFVERLPDGIYTKVGDGGTGLSKGQKQSILIARAVYHKPDYLFLDEAANDLDAENEETVLKRIEEAFRGKTLVIIANRMENLPLKIDNIIPLAPPKTRRRNEPGGMASVSGGSRRANGAANGNGQYDNLDELVFEQ
jgi:ATP-binding cassette subfamily B protein